VSETDRAAARVAKPRIRILRSQNTLPGARLYEVTLAGTRGRFWLDTNRMSILAKAIQHNSGQPYINWIHGVYYG
jgi:hypothetical protein